MSGREGENPAEPTAVQMKAKLYTALGLYNFRLTDVETLKEKSDV